MRQQQAEHPFEAEQLRELLALQNLPFLPDIPTIGTQTTAIDVSNFDADITIDKGRADGVAYGMPVVGSGGLVGQVIQANHHSSIVQLITDPQSKVGVMIGTGARSATSSTAVVEGQGAGAPLLALFVAESTTLHKGQVLYTNGLQGAAFPSGIPVGRVTRFRTTAGGTQLTVQAEPAADLTNLRYLDVVQWEPAP